VLANVAVLENVCLFILGYKFSHLPLFPSENLIVKNKEIF
jgi:hypothetical protein